jgi:hydroxymethylpyrimidine/phosphomethylpyrimidine kinase
VKRALTIAGSDSGGGAGIQADLKTFAALGVYGASAITAITAQNTKAVTRIQEVDPEVVTAQIEAVLADIGADAVKTGMLASAAIVEAVAAALARLPVPHLVVDPVMIAKSGAALLRDDAVAILAARLLPLAEVVTPNLPESARLTGGDAGSDAALGDRALEDRARRIAALGPRVVVIKGGHATGPESVDLFFDGTRFERIRGPRIDTRATHGTGCTFSAALAAGLALGQGPYEAALSARRYLEAALLAAPRIGSGAGPLDHFHASRSRRS